MSFFCGNLANSRRRRRTTSELVPRRLSIFHQGLCEQANATVGGDDDIRSSRAQARAALGREFPTLTLSIMRRVPSPPFVHVSCAPSKFRTLSSPQSGFKPWRLSINPTLPESPTGVKHQVCIPSRLSQFDSVFVVPWPSCRVVY